MTLMLDAIWKEEATAVLPQPAPSSYVEFARTIILPDGAEKGKAYNPATHPAQLTLLQSMDGGTYFAPKPFSQIAAAKPVQDGGSLATLVPLLRRIVQQRQTVLLAFPSLDSAKDIWTTKVVPILAAYGGQEPESGGGSRGGAARVVTLPNGGRFMLRAAGGRGESQQASVTGDALCIDEADDWPDLHRIELMAKRLEEAPDPLLLIVCTVKRGALEGDEASIILAAVAEGTDSRLHFMCPDCQAFQALEWEQVRYEPAGQSCVGGSSRYVCLHCGTAHQEAGRQAMLARWLVVHRGQTVVGAGAEARVDGPIPETPRFSLRWSRLESPRRSLHSLCAANARAKWYLSEKGDHGPMRSFVQDYLTKPYQEDAGDRIDLAEGTMAAAANRSTYRRGEIPDVCDIVNITADIQLRRHYWLGVAFDPNDDWYIFDWGRDPICLDMEQPSKDQRQAGLDRLDDLARAGFRRTDGEILMPHCAVDTGFRADEIRPWIAKRRQRWIAAKGAGEELTSRMVRAPVGARQSYEQGWYDIRRQEESPDKLQMFVSADDILDRIAADLIAGRGHLPQDADAELIKHLSGMQPGKEKRWEPRGARHDYLDDLIYALALARSRRKRMPKAGQPVTAPAAAAPDSNWMGGFNVDSGSGW